MPPVESEVLALSEPKWPLANRDASILAFNERVLSLASNPATPLLERLRFLCIVSSNLDEFFEVRFGPLLSVFKAISRTVQPESAEFHAMSAQAHDLVERQYRVFNDDVMPALSKSGVRLLSHSERDAKQRRWVKDYFESHVQPLLVPVALDPAHPFPQVANKSLNFIVHLKGTDAFGRKNEVAIVRVPRVLPRVIAMPDKLAKKLHSFVSLSSVIRAHLSDIFPGRTVGDFSQFRVTRHSDLEVGDEDAGNLRKALQRGLQHRNFGQPVRLEVSSGCPDALALLLLKQFGLPAEAMFSVHGPVNLVRLMQLVDLVSAPLLKYEPHVPVWPKSLSQHAPIFAQIAKKDVLMHHPFETFDAVLGFLREAVEDPNVMAIKQTIYRTGSDEQMLNLYKEAMRRGKEVLAVVELKARFDEEANINWAESLERIGAQVVYGVMGLKTHAKMLLVTRKEGQKLRRYGHLSTGNYNPKTARLYTDLGYFTADEAITSDMDTVFRHLASHSPVVGLKKLWMAPFTLQSNMVSAVNRVRLAAKLGQEARIVAKMNALTDELLIHALIDAGRAGARIDLIVRGACMLPSQAFGLAQPIRVHSVVGRFLEHSRIFYFAAHDETNLYLSSADFMGRNMLRRVELAWPVTDPELRQRVIDECLVPYLYDTQDAWQLEGDGQYSKARSDEPLSAHRALLQLFREGALPDPNAVSI